MSIHSATQNVFQRLSSRFIHRGFHFFLIGTSILALSACHHSNNGKKKSHENPAPFSAWNKRFGGNNTDQCNAVVRNHDGSYVLAGTSNSESGDDKNENAYASSNDYWVVKIDATGDKVWDKQFGGNGNDACQSIIASGDGGYILAGYSDSDISGNKTQNTYNSSTDYWVVKIDADGNKLWDYRYGGDSADYCYGVVASGDSEDNGYLLYGASYSTTSVGTDISEASFGGSGDYWVVKIDADGTYDWDKRYGGAGSDYCYAAIANNDGSYVLAGASDSDISGNKSQNANSSSTDYWVVNIADNGSVNWDACFGGNGTDECHALIASGDDYLLAGFSDSNTTGDKTEDTRGGYDYWVVKIDETGTYTSDKSYGSSGGDDCFSIIASDDDGFIISGESDSDTGDDVTEDTYGTYDMRAFKIDNNGDKVWDKCFGGDDCDTATTALSLGDGNYLIAGYSQSGITGNKSEDTRGGYDFWAVSFHQPEPSTLQVPLSAALSSPPMGNN